MEAEGEGKPGRGGVSRGRGDAAMWYTKPSSEEGTGFIESQVKPAGGMDTEKSVLTGIRATAPEVNKNAAAASGALGGTQADGGAAAGQVVLPEHKAVVRQYFNREKQ